MKISERIRNMVRGWLRIEPAQPSSIVIYEPLSHITNVLKNKIWYRGDATEIDQFFKKLNVSDTVNAARFWAKAPIDETIRKAHCGLPGIMVDTLVSVVKADLGDIDFGEDKADKNSKKRWTGIANENAFKDLVGEAITETCVSGDGAFKISIDTDVSAHPIIEFWSADRVEYEVKRGRVVAVAFKTPYAKGDNEYILKEIYRVGSISYVLEIEDKVVPLKTIPELAKLMPVKYDGDYMMAVPLKFWKSAKFKGRGRSLYDNKTDAFDGHDEVISQWLDAIRSGRVKEYIPEDLIPRNEKNGSLMMPNLFGSRYVVTEGQQSKEGVISKVEAVQPDIAYEAFLASYTATLNICLQGIMSPATLGIDVGKMSSADAQREKKDITGITRNAISDALETCLALLAQTVLKVDDCLFKNNIGIYNASVSFGEYAAPDFETRIATISTAAASNIMSIETQVSELWGASKEKEWQEAEVKRILEERGGFETEEPFVGDEL